jgi:hypothetical protein
MARGDDLEERLIEFGVRIIHVTNHLPKNRAGRQRLNMRKPGPQKVAGISCTSSRSD